MQILNSLTNFNEETPDLAFTKGSTHLTFDMHAEISVFTVLHDDIDDTPFSE